MIDLFKRTSIAAQAAAMLTLILLATVSVLFFWATENAVSAELQHARTVADMADAFRALAALHGGFYVRRETQDDPASVGRYLATFRSASSGNGPDFVFHQKNPFLALSDYSEVVQQSPAMAKFRMTSDNNFNPANQPDDFDLGAMHRMREEGVREVYGVLKGQLRYARALRADKPCLACHGAAQDAPAAVQAQYRAPVGAPRGGGYGYREGEIVGVTSVSVPHSTPREMILRQTSGFWVSVTVVIGLMLGAFGLVLRGIVMPLRQLSRYAGRVASGDDLARLKQPRFSDDEAYSRNEIHQEAQALKTLHEAMLAAINRLRRYAAANR